MAKEWIQHAAATSSPSRAAKLSFSTPAEVHASGAMVRRDIQTRRISYAKGMRELIFAYNAMNASRNIASNDARLVALRQQINITKGLKASYGKK